MLEKVVKSNYDTYNDLDKLLDEAKEYLDSNLIRKKFNFNTLGEKLNYLFKTKGNYKDLVRVSLIKAGLKDLKNEIKQMSRMEIFKNKPDEIVNLVEKILDANERQLDKYYSPRESPIDKDKDFGLELKRMFCDEEISDMPELESEKSAEKRKK